MSDYTPTTEEVKANYALVGDDEVVNNINEQKFDRWLAQRDAEVAKATETRIIKLLDNYCDGNHSMFDQCSCAMQIALIKGEK